MDQGDANLFDPLMVGAKEAGGESNGVMVEDLLGGFSEMVPPDLKAADPNPANGSATSFFLLDLDTGGGNASEISAPDFMLGKTGAALIRPTSALESMSDNSEVLSITEANLPMGNDGNNDDDALMSGFFNDVLETDSVPDRATLANAATVQIAMMDSSATTSSETTLVGKEMVSAAAFGHGLTAMGASEENLDSIMDLEIPASEPSRDLFDTVTEVEPMCGGEGRLVKVSTVENLVTEEGVIENLEDEAVIGGGDRTVNGEVVKKPPHQFNGEGGIELSDEHPLASQLKPVFEMFDPEGKGWIGVDQLQELCRSQGQVISLLSQAYLLFQIFLKFLILLYRENPGCVGAGGKN